MSVRLSDVNVLIGLLDYAHVHHSGAVAWFRRLRRKKMGTLRGNRKRIYSHCLERKLPKPEIDAGGGCRAARAVKRSFAGIHEFWADEVSLTDSSLFDLTILTSAGQTTDTWLAGLACRRSGRVATLDAGIPWRAVRGAERHWSRGSFPDRKSLTHGSSRLGQAVI